ncbi:MAG TPA: exodeoxyribonuclease VII small subunit [Planctomycetota bacterium]|nr:exodeoxyribonuclease VII small subunit [Planctomycetota bacterium]
MAAEKSPAKKERFEDQLKVVEDVVNALQSGKLGLEESLEKYEAGIAALRSCYRILEEAERKIQVLVKEKDGSLTARDLDADAKASRKKADAS